MKKQPVKLTKEKLFKFFDERPAISMTAFSKECGLSAAHIRQIKQERFELTEKTIAKIWPVLLKYGYGYEIE